MGTGALLVAFACGDDVTRHDDPSARVRAVRISERVAAEVDRRFVSFAVDSAQLVGGSWWTAEPRPNSTTGDAPQPVFDWRRARLRRLAAPLAPAFLRLGGSAADEIWYDLSEDPGPPPEGFDLVMTAHQWDEAMRFARDLGFDVLFTLNAGPGPRDVRGAWSSTNARALMAHAAARSDPVAVWELGNEVNAFPVIHGFTFRVSPEQYASDVRAARSLVDELTPEARLAGPSSAYWPELGEVPQFYESFMPLGGAALDVITWHYYPQQSRRCGLRARPASAELMQDPNALDEVRKWAETVESAAQAHAPGAPVWLGETGNAQCGGEPGVSDSYPGGFWWLDQLGLMARRGQPVVVRQSLTGASYGLLTEPDLQPRPDYWTTLLFRRLMGPRVLRVEVPDDRRLRVYAHCAPGGGVGVAALNLHRERGAKARLEGLEVERARAFRLEPRSAGAELALNGEVLRLDVNGDLPSLEGAPETLDRDAPELWVPAGSYALFLLEDARLSACDGS
jgi:heparanase 1